MVFPGETRKYFENTEKTFKNINIAFAYISRYSPRPQTIAFKLKDNVSPAEKKQRERKLLEIIEKSGLAFNKKFLNKTVDVLILKEKKGFYFGKTRHYQTIRIAQLINESGPAHNASRSDAGGSRCSPNSLIGEFVKAKVIKATPYGLEGKIQ